MMQAMVLLSGVKMGRDGEEIATEGDPGCNKLSERCLFTEIDAV